jgi:hypothetical protein
VVFCIVDINQRNALMSVMTINFTTPPRNYFTTPSAPKRLQHKASKQATSIKCTSDASTSLSQPKANRTPV